MRFFKVEQQQPSAKMIRCQCGHHSPREFILTINGRPVRHRWNPKRDSMIPIACRDCLEEHFTNTEIHDDLVKPVERAAPGKRRALETVRTRQGRADS